MQTPINPFKQALADKRAQIGLWLGLASPYSTEICAGAGFDWLLIDGEHAPNDIPSILAQLQVIAGYPASHAIARVPMGHGHVGEALIKQYLDIGVQTLLVPMVDTAEQAQQLVRATRYAPEGVRGMGSALARSSRDALSAEETTRRPVELGSLFEDGASDFIDAALARQIDLGFEAGTRRRGGDGFCTDR